MMKVKIFTIWDEPEDAKHCRDSLRDTEKEINRFLAGKAILGCDEADCPADATGDCPVPMGETMPEYCEKVIYPIPEVKFVTQSQSQDPKTSPYTIISIFYEEKIAEKSPESNEMEIDAAIEEAQEKLNQILKTKQTFVPPR